MKTFYKIYQYVYKNLASDKKDIWPKLNSLCMGRNINYLIKLYGGTRSLKEKQFILNIIYGIWRNNRRMSRGQKDVLSKFIIKELNKHILYINKFEIVAKYELKELGPYLLRILEKQWDTLPVGELDTLIFALGMIGYKPAQKYIMKFLDSEHRTVRECAKQALERLKKRKKVYREI